MIRSLKHKDLINFVSFCSQRDKFSDFYVTKNDKRLFLNNQKIAEKVFNDCLKNGDKSFIYEENNEIKGVLLIVGYSDKSDRKYIKILANDEKVMDSLFKMLMWTINTDLYLKIRKDNPILKFLQNGIYKERQQYKYFFIMIGERGQNNERVLLIYKPEGKIKPLQNIIKDGD